MSLWPNEYFLLPLLDFMTFSTPEPVPRGRLGLRGFTNDDVWKGEGGGGGGGRSKPLVLGDIARTDPPDLEKASADTKRPLWRDRGGGAAFVATRRGSRPVASA